MTCTPLVLDWPHRITPYETIHGDVWYRIEINWAGDTWLEPRKQGGGYCTSECQFPTWGEAATCLNGQVDGAKRLQYDEGLGYWVVVTAVLYEASVQVSIEALPPEIEYASIHILMDGEHIYGECWGNQAECTHPTVTAPATIGYTYRFVPPEGVHTYTAKYHVRARGVEKEGLSNPITL